MQYLGQCRHETAANGHKYCRHLFDRRNFFYKETILVKRGCTMAGCVDAAAGAPDGGDSHVAAAPAVDGGDEATCAASDGGEDDGGDSHVAAAPGEVISEANEEACRCTYYVVRGVGRSSNTTGGGKAKSQRKTNK